MLRARLHSPVEILHVVNTLDQGGAEQNLLTILRHLPPAQYKHHLAWLRGDDLLRGEFEQHVKTMLPLDAPSPRSLIGASWRLARWMRRQRPAIVHAQLVDAQLVARAAAVMTTRPPIVTTWQNSFYDDEALAEFGRSRIKRGIVRGLDDLSGRYDAHFIAVSEYVAAQCGQALHVSRDRITVVYNAVDPKRYRPVEHSTLERIREGLGVAKAAKLLLTVGRLVAQKEQRVAIAALAAVRKRNPDAILLIAGRGALEEELRSAAAAAGVIHAVKFLGHRSDVSALYQLADLFVFPSRYEGLSVALVEAAANGLPAVVSDIPQNREVAAILDSVKLAPVGNTEAFASAIVSMLDESDPCRARALRNARSIQQRFSPDLLAREWSDVIGRIAGRIRARTRNIG